MKKNEKVKLTSIFSQNNKYYLNNIHNYKEQVDDNEGDILCKYISLITEYMVFISENINITKQKYYLFILERGFDTITHVFKIIYYYTKNLELTYYHCQKAYYFYIEFIEQISDDKHTFLQLSSRDATMFVYKKTIFEINNEYRKNIKELNESEKKIFTAIDLSISIYKNIMVYVINHTDFKYNNKTEYITDCCKEIRKINTKMNQYILQQQTMNFIHLFIHNLANKKIDVKDFFIKIEDFMKIVSKKNNISKKTQIGENEIILLTFDIL